MRFRVRTLSVYGHYRVLCSLGKEHRHGDIHDESLGFQLDFVSDTSLA